MGRPVIFTRAVIRQIAPWVHDGARPAEIAQRIGCTVGTLRVRCSQLGISLRRPGTRSSQSNQTVSALARATSSQPAIACFQVTLNQPRMDQFEGSARARGLSSAALAQALFEVIVQDGLYEAILDEELPHANGFASSTTVA